MELHWQLSKRFNSYLKMWVRCHVGGAETESNDARRCEGSGWMCGLCFSSRHLRPLQMRRALYLLTGASVSTEPVIGSDCSGVRAPAIFLPGISTKPPNN